MLFQNFKKQVFSMLLIVPCIVLLYCKKDSDSINNSENLITIKGAFPAPASKVYYDRMEFTTVLSFVSSDVSKVIVFSGDYKDFYIQQVVNGSFAIDVTRDKPYGIVFANSSNNFLGYITFRDGINSLPVNVIDESISNIDLGTLTASGTVIEPQFNPIGNQIVLSSEEIAALAQSNSFLSSVVQNPDADGDSIIDILTDTYYLIHVQYWIEAGNFGSNTEPSIATSNWMRGFKMSLFVYSSTGNFPTSLTWTGPNGSGLNNSTSSERITFGNNQIMYWSQHVSDPTFPPGGTYTIQYNSRTLTFTVPDQSNAPNNVVFAIPTVHLNSDNTIRSISWRYTRPGSNNEINPKLFLESLMIQVFGSGSQCEYDPQHPDQIYQSGNIDDMTIREHVLRCDHFINWANVTGIGMCYNDKFGNHYVVMFRK